MTKKCEKRLIFFKKSCFGIVWFAWVLKGNRSPYRGIYAGDLTQSGVGNRFFGGMGELRKNLRFVFLGGILSTIFLFSGVSWAEPVFEESLSAMLRRSSPDFDGPNCFNTALLATGVLPIDDVRYVDWEEFEFYLQHAFHLVNGKPERGDLVVYAASSERDHAAVYLGDGQVLHKKDFNSSYEYRVVGIEEVFDHEPGDDRPRRPEDPAPIFSDEEAVQDRAFYRRDSFIELPEVPFDLRTAKNLLDFVLIAVLEHAPSWDVGENLGIVSENLTGVMTRRYSDTPQITVLAKSLTYQIYQSIIAEHFRSVYAQSRPEPIERRIYFSPNHYLRDLILLVGEVEGFALSEAEIDEVIKKLEDDRPSRRLDLFEAVHLY